MINICPHKNLYTNVHHSIIHNSKKKWKQGKCLSIDKWIKKMWHIHTMAFYLALKKNEVPIHAIVYSMNEPWKLYAK